MANQNDAQVNLTAIIESGESKSVKLFFLPINGVNWSNREWERNIHLDNLFTEKQWVKNLDIWDGVDLLPYQPPPLTTSLPVKSSVTTNSSHIKQSSTHVIQGKDFLRNKYFFSWPHNHQTIQIKMFEGMIRELKEVRYVSQLKRNLILVGALKTLSLEVSIKDAILKMTKGSMVVLKGIRWNNLYYLKDSTVTW